MVSLKSSSEYSLDLTDIVIGYLVLGMMYKKNQESTVINNNKQEKSFIARNLKSIFIRNEDKNHIKILDGLRAISITWVFLFHYIYIMLFADKDLALHYIKNRIFTIEVWGFFGVQMFFVISGFIVGLILINEFQRTNSLDMKRFWIRRVYRIVPAYYCTLFLLLLIDNNADKFKAMPNFFFLNNHFFGTGYEYMAWAWSLAVEMQFYLLLPLLIIACGNLIKLRNVVIGLIALSFVLRFLIIKVYAVRVCLDDCPVDSYLYPLLISRYGELLIGVLAALLYTINNIQDKIGQHQKKAKILLLLSFCIVLPLVFSQMPLNMNDTKPVSIFLIFYNNIFCAAIAYIILYSISQENSYIARFLSAKIWYPISQLSYSTYLLHLIVIAIYYKFFYTKGVVMSGLEHYTQMMILMIISLSSAAVMYVFVEKPFIDLRRKKI